MKTSIHILSIFFVVACGAHARHALAQEQPEPALDPNKLSAGISAGHYRYDPGLGVEFTTRAILQNHLSLRVRGSVQWLEAYQAVHYSWMSYQTFSTGLVYNSKLFERTRFYAEFGILGILPNPRFSDKTCSKGVYEFNGLEIILLPRKDYTLCLYFGAGPAFINAFADKIEGNPRFGNCLHFINGFRIYFGNRNYIKKAKTCSVDSSRLSTAFCRQ